ncbi:MAG TPA: hypothetical protein VKA05_02190 [Acidimicrobiales bacterium]|nr:hypothetical protein [Acidimicrobiales bacterium]
MIAMMTASVLAMTAMSSATAGAATRHARPSGPVAAAAPRKAPDLVWVARADSGPVAAYAAGSSGAVSPVRQVANPDNPSTVWDPWGLAFDAAGSLYVQSFLSDATTFVFAPNLAAGAKPIRIFKADGPDNRGIAIDAEGFEYVAGGEASAIIGVERPKANGQPGDLYNVVPLRQIQTGGAFDPWPSFLASGLDDDVLAAVTLPQGNAVEVFKGGASGSGTALRRIAGSRTDLGACSDSCDHLAIAFSPLTDELYVAVSSATGATRICVFAGNARGNVAPLRVISGAHTGLEGQVITGIAASQRTGDLYVMVKKSEFGDPGKIERFSGLANSNAFPLSSFTDPQDDFADAMGIAVH